MTSKVANNRLGLAVFSTANQSKIQLLFHKNISPRDFYMMTLVIMYVLTFELLIEYIVGLINYIRPGLFEVYIVAPLVSQLWGTGEKKMLTIIFLKKSQK